MDIILFYQTQLNYDLPAYLMCALQEINAEFVVSFRQANVLNDQKNIPGHLISVCDGHIIDDTMYLFVIST